MTTSPVRSRDSPTVYVVMVGPATVIPVSSAGAFSLTVIVNVAVCPPYVTVTVVSSTVSSAPSDGTVVYPSTATEDPSS